MATNGYYQSRNAVLLGRASAGDFTGSVATLQTVLTLCMHLSDGTSPVVYEQGSCDEISQGRAI